MATFAIQVAAVASLTERQRSFARILGEHCALGSGALYHDEHGTLHQLFDDPRFTVRDGARAGVLLAHISSIPDDMEPTSEAVIPWVDSVGVVMPSEDSENPYLEALQINGAPPVVWMGPGVPDNWTPKED